MIPVFIALHCDGRERVVVDRVNRQYIQNTVSILDYRPNSTRYLVLYSSTVPVTGWAQLWTACRSPAVHQYKILFLFFCSILDDHDDIVHGVDDSIRVTHVSTSVLAYKMYYSLC